jgi:hypothetical protein
MSIRSNQLKSIIRTASASGDAQDYAKRHERCDGTVCSHNLRSVTTLPATAAPDITPRKPSERANAAMAKAPSAPATGQLTHSHR